MNNEFILRKNKSQIIPNRKINNWFRPNEYINNYNTKKVSNKKNNSNLLIKNNFDLEEERKILIQMAK